MKARIRAALIKRMGQVLDPACCAEIELELLATEDLSIDPAQFGAVQCGRLTFRAERFADVLPELHELHKTHWLETEKHRHGLAMKLMNRGRAPTSLISSVLGHASEKTTERFYAHWENETLVNAYDEAMGRADD